MKTRHILLPLALGAILACSRRQPVAETGAPGEAPAHADDARGEAPVPLAGLVGVSFSAVGAPVAEGSWYAAEALADESTRLAIASPVSGIVARLASPVGRELRAGAVLAEIRSPELAGLKSDWLAAAAERERAAAEVAREERLAAAGAGAARELESARAALSTAVAAEAARRLALEARGVDPKDAGATLVVRAPHAGRIAEWTALEGQGVEAGGRLATFDAGGARLVKVELPPPGASAWIPGVETRVRRSDGREWLARVEGVPASLSESTRRLAYRLRLEDAADLPFAGTPLEARVPLPAGVVLPQTALQQIEGTWGVFVAQGENAEFRRVRRGPELGGDVVVLEGIAPGERVATTGAYLLKALLLKRAGGGEEHEH